MAQLVVEVCVCGSPGGYRFGTSGIRNVQNAPHVSDRDCGKEICDSVGAGASNTHAVAHLFDSGACTEIGKIGVAVAEAHAAFAIGGKHQSQANGGHQDQSEEHHYQRDAAFGFFSLCLHN
jgi:hypothetical protein